MVSIQNWVGQVDGYRDAPVHSLAVLSCSFLFLLYFCAISGTSGSAGFGSASI